ncbi:MAG: amino acid permease [Hyphomicrobiaceae bacterium]|nr:amino acid permease [Hyphomicrobiaceae bacterium]MCC0006503.1 amino acid permease [Hyphomicrobiaceae bacterium]
MDAKVQPSIGPARNITKTISAFTATSIAVADMVGIGVFTSLGFQVRDIESGFALLMLWVVGGVVALSGALCYAELAAMFPRSGGEYNFLARAYHPAVGFMAGWLSATVGFAAPIALAAMAFGAYLNGVLPGTPAPTLVALVITWLVAAVHLSGIRQSSAFQNASTVFKVVLILGFIVAIFALAEPQPISFAPELADLGRMTSAPFAISLVFVMYSYSGWNASTYIVDEMTAPQRDVPRSLITATLIVLLLYVGLNAAFLYSTPVAKMAGEVEVALVVGKHVFGETGGRIVGALICIGLVSAISAMMWIGPRVTRVMGEDLPALSIFSRTTSNGVPAVAILLQAAIVTALVLTQSFEGILEFIQFALTLSSFLAVVAVIVLRRTRPDLKRPYRAWGYPVTPYIFLAVTAFMMGYLLVERPIQSLAGLALLTTGLLVFRFGAGRAASQTAN